MSNENTADNIEPSDEQVARYLRNHPGFFLKHEELLSEIKLSHASGSATSLLERQVSLLRERNIEARGRLGELFATASDNDQLFQKSRALVLTALSAGKLNELCKSWKEQLLSDFDIEAASIIFFQSKPPLSGSAARVIPSEKVDQVIGGLLRSGGTFCGPLRDHEAEFLFTGNSDTVIASAAIAPFNHQQCSGLLCLGSAQGDHFHKAMATDFIDYLAEVFSRCAARLSG